MSYPPRGPPMGMGMMGGYGYPPMGMMPMGMMSGQNAQNYPIQNSGSQSGTREREETKSKLVPQEIPKDDDEKPPVTTVFVGNISDKAPDAMIKQMLSRCGNVLSWKRVQGASGKLQAFGFCEYERPEATLRCIRLLNDWEIADKKLVVKVDAKTKAELEEYQTKKKKKKYDETNTDEFSQREDRVAQAGLDAIMKEYAGEINKNKQIAAKQEAEERRMKQILEKAAQQGGVTDNKPRIRDIGLDDLQIDDAEKDLIHREINSFRSLHKDDEKDSKDDKRDEPRTRDRRRDERDRTWGRNRNLFTEPDAGNNRHNLAINQSRERGDSRKYQTKTRSRSPVSRSRTPDRYGRGDRDSRDKDDDEEEIYERRKLERKLKEKEAAYQERLKNWEGRERKKGRDYEKDKIKEEDRRMEESKEARRLREFLEDYDDERDDPKYYKSSALSRRLKEREREIEADNKDRQREKDEIEEIRKKLLEEGHPDPEAELAKIGQNQEKQDKIEDLKEAVNENTSKVLENIPHKDYMDTATNAGAGDYSLQATLKPVNLVPDAPISSDDDDQETGIIIPESQPEQAGSPDEEASSMFIGPQGPPAHSTHHENQNNGDSPGSSYQHDLRKGKLSVHKVFNSDEDEETPVVKKRKLVPLDYNEDEQAAIASKASAEEKRQLIKNLIEKIPTAKEELFAYTLSWGQVDSTLMEKRIKPWVNKKIIEYIGEEEPTLTEFICQKVMAHSAPQSILNDVAMVLDEEAEVFVVKMWRLLIYETEAKKLGLAK